MSSQLTRHQLERDDVGRFPTLLCGITLAVTLATLALVAWSSYEKYRLAETLRHRDSRIQTLHGVILRLDEVLTMSAQMAAATGDLRWERRYRHFDPQLDAAIREAEGLVPGGSSIVAMKETDAANVKLEAMENSAFSLVQAGRTEEAHDALSSPAYESEKRQYSTNLDAVLHEQQKRVDDALDQANRRFTLLLAALAALLLFSIATWIVILGRLRGMQGKLGRRVAERTVDLRAVNVELLAARDAAEAAAEVNALLARESALILNSATDGIIRIGLDNRATFLNPAGAKMLGATLSDMQGKSVHDAIHHSHPDGTPWLEADCARTQAMRRGELVAGTEDTFWRPDGTSFPVEYSFTPMFDEHENKLGAVVMFRDVTERKAIERMKSEFVATVSHDLRTPLTSIRGALGLLSSGALGAIGEKGRRMLDIAVSNTDRLVRLINDILDLERIGSGAVELQRGAVDANAVMVQAVEAVESMAEQAGVRLDILPATATFWGDSDRIIQTLTNLVGNAIKFSPADTIVTVSGSQRDGDFLFCVADQGRGIPDEKLETIFERFSQVNSSDSRDKGGTGLGLAICQSIVRAHGGRIWAEKNEPAGSRLKFTIPLKASASAAPPAIQPPPFAAISDREEVKGRSILIVEEDLDLARVMTAALEGRGIRTFHAVTGSEAIRMCREYEPSLIVLGLMLPDMDGYEVVSSLRRSATLERIPLIVYSALDVGSADQARLRLGPTEFLTKSRCSPAEFEAHVVRLLASVTSCRLSARDSAA
jgi:PAS domain S-box-containing protein